MTESVTRTLAPTFLIRVVALAGDEESGIMSMALVSNFTFRCGASVHNSEIIGILEGGPLTFTPAIPAASAPFSTPWAINVVADPISMIGCGQDPRAVWAGARGPIEMEGYLRVVATNGSGVTATSKVFNFNYVNIGHR